MSQNGMNQKPFASGGPTGLLTLAFYISFLWPLTTGRVSAAYLGVLIPLGVIVAVVQIISGIIELRDGNILEGTIPLAFSCFMALGAGEAALKLAGLLPADTALIDGHIMVVMGLLMTALLVYAVSEPCMAFLFYLANACFFLPAGVGSLLGMAPLVEAASWSMLLVAVTAFWCGVAQLLEKSMGRKVLWMGPSLVKRPPR